MFNVVIDWSVDQIKGGIMFIEVGAYEAKTKLPELLRSVKNGKRFTITHRGEPIADLVPTKTSTIDRIKAIDSMKSFSSKANVSHETLKKYRSRGRK